MSDSEKEFELRRRAVLDFLRRCLAYAEEAIKKKEKSGDDADGLAKWLAYHDYTLYAVDEVERGELDHWFTDWLDARPE